MSTKDYREMATSLRSMRVELLMRSALQPPSSMGRMQHFALWRLTHALLNLQEQLGGSYAVTHQLLRMHRTAILNK